MQNWNQELLGGERAACKTGLLQMHNLELTGRLQSRRKTHQFELTMQVPVSGANSVPLEGKVGVCAETHGWNPGLLPKSGEPLPYKCIMNRIWEV